MKKTIIVILLLAVVAAGVFYVIKILPGAKKVSSLESLVPEDALFYTYSYDPDKKIKEFRASDFFGKFAKSSIYKAWLEPQLNQLYQNAPFLSDFLQKDVAVALFSLGNPQSLHFSIQDLGDFLVLVRLDPQKHKQIQRQALDVYLSVAGKGKATFKTYKGVKISKYTSVKPVFTINYAFIADVLVLSNNANVIQNSVDLYQKTIKKSLSENSHFQNIKARIKNDTWVWGYHNNEAYNRQLFAYYASGALRSKGGRWAAYAMDPTQLAPMMELMNLIKVSGFSFERDILKEGFLCKGYYFIGEPKSKAISEFAKFITDKRILGEEVLRLVPRDILLYLGGRRDILTLWKFIKYSFARISQTAVAPYSGRGSAEVTKEIKDGLAKVDSFLGVSVEKDILPALGDNFGFAVANLENTEINMLNPQAQSSSPAMGGFSIAVPQAYTYLEIKDVPKISALLEGAVRKLVEKANQQIKERESRWKETLGQEAPASAEKQEDLIPQEEAQPPLTFLKDTYQEAEIFYIDLLNFPLTSFKPNYCFLDKYVIFSYSMPLTKKVIDVYKNKGNSFARNSNFLSIKEKIPAGYSAIAFFDIKRTVDELKRVKFFESILYQIAVSSAPQGVAKDGLGQLSDALSDLVSITSASRVLEQDIIETDLYIKIKGL